MFTRNEQKRIITFARDYVRLSSGIKNIRKKINYLGHRITPAKALQLQSRLMYLLREIEKAKRQQNNFGQTLIRKYKIPVRGNASIQNALRIKTAVNLRLRTAKPLYKTPLPNNIVHTIVRTAYPI